jgi:predicted small lipoprotein YifL
VRKAILSLTVAALAVSCSGCGEKETAKPEDPASAAPQPSAKPGKSGRVRAPVTSKTNMPSNKMVD